MIKTRVFLEMNSRKLTASGVSMQWGAEGLEFGTRLTAINLN